MPSEVAIRTFNVRFPLDLAREIRLVCTALGLKHHDFFAEAAKKHLRDLVNGDTEEEAVRERIAEASDVLSKYLDQ